MRVGLKSLFCLLLLAGVAALLSRLGFLILKKLASSEPFTLFVTGVFTVLSAAVFLRFYGKEKSETLLVFSRNLPGPGEAELFRLGRLRCFLVQNRKKSGSELPLVLQRLTVVLSVFLCGALTIDDRAISLVKDLPATREFSPAEYCLDRETEEKPAEIPGCQLILRAFDMGLVENPGDCKPELTREKDSDLEPDICELRQTDEPLLHYNFRQLLSSLGALITFPFLVWIKERYEKIRFQMQEIVPLFRFQTAVLSSAPGASHHIFTNLPPPGGRVLHTLRAIFLPDRCSRQSGQRLQLAAMEKSKQDNSQRFGFVVEQLLFNSAYRFAAGYCRNYEIHWGGPEDSCQRFQKNPDSFLRESGIFPRIQSILERKLLNQEISDIQNHLKGWGSEKAHGGEEISQDKKTQRLPVAFYCFHLVDDETRESAYPVNLGAWQSEAREVRFLREEVQESGFPVGWFRQVARLFIPGFNYGGFLSRQLMRNRDQGDLSSLFRSPETFMLARSVLLENEDMLLKDSWLSAREDLLEIYPWQLHLRHFIEIFRKHYQARWSGL